MGFEQTILEVLSTIRGERLPGLKEKEVRIILLYGHTFSAVLTLQTCGSHARFSFSYLQHDDLWLIYPCILSQNFTLPPSLFHTLILSLSLSLSYCTFFPLYHLDIQVPKRKVESVCVSVRESQKVREEEWSFEREYRGRLITNHRVVSTTN